MLDLTYWRSVHDISGLHGLIVLGADICEICEVRKCDRRRLGITEEDDKAAHAAYDKAEKVGFGYIINLPHKHMRSITDFMLCSLIEYVAIAPDGNVIVRPFDDLREEYEWVFGGNKAKLIDDSYLLFSSKFKDEVVEVFKNYEIKLYRRQCRRKRLKVQCIIYLLLHQS